jgi:hypothetical protein
MASATIDDVNKNVLLLGKRLRMIEAVLEENDLELREEVKSAIEESRNRASSEFKTQEEIEEEFL